MKLINRLTASADNLQKRHGFIGFPAAVIKKYHEDEAGYQAGLLTYYGFLSLFPLFLLLTTVLQIILNHDAALRARIIKSAATYFPVLGTHLQQSIHKVDESGLALAISLALTFYGARGVAAVFQRCVNNIWHIPREARPGFPHNLIKSFVIMIIGGIGLVTASVTVSYSTVIGHTLLVKAIFTIINLAILFVLFTILIKISLPVHISVKDVFPGAAAIAVGLVILQTFGGYILAHELKHLDLFYSTFALALGVMFWIYLQAQVVLYALEINTVHSKKLWPKLV